MLCVISGPSGVGKGTVVAELRRIRPDVILSVSATTRPRRPGEVDGRHYRFLDPVEFDALVEADGFLEWAEYAGNRYGTPAAPVLAAIDAGHRVVLEIEVQGARQIRERMPEAVTILITPPSIEELARRLRQRATEPEEIIQRRLQQAENELAEAPTFDHVVVNDEVDRAAEEIARILDSTPTG